MRLKTACAWVSLQLHKIYIVRVEVASSLKDVTCLGTAWYQLGIMQKT